MSGPLRIMIEVPPGGLSERQIRQLLGLELQAAAEDGLIPDSPVRHLDDVDSMVSALKHCAMADPED